MKALRNKESPTSRDVFLLFCTRDFGAPLIRLGDGSLVLITCLFNSSWSTHATMVMGIWFWLTPPGVNTTNNSPRVCLCLLGGEYGKFP